MACFYTNGIIGGSVYDFTQINPTLSLCAAADSSATDPASYYWVETASVTETGSFDITSAQTLVALTFGALAMAYTFRILRDMILNRR